MGSIKVQVATGANMGTICDEIIAAAAAAAPGSNPKAAQIIRDTNGKVVEVLVNLPEVNDAPGLQTAADAIQANNGVSKSQKQGNILIDDDFDGLTPGASLGSVGSNYDWNGGVTPASMAYARLDGGGSAQSVLTAGYGNESDGTSSLMFQPRSSVSTASYVVSGRVGVEPGVLDYPTAIFKWEFDVKFPTTVNSVACGATSSVSRVLSLAGGVFFDSDRLLMDDGANIFLYDFNSASSVDTGVAVGTSHNLVYTLDLRVLAGPSSVVIDGGSPIYFTASGSGGGVIGGPGACMSLRQATTMSTPGAYVADEVPPVIFDNVKFTHLGS